MKCELRTICDFRKGKIEVSKLNQSTYISTENMVPDKGGVVEASSLPNSLTTQEFQPGDILVSNIRPYFKKIWHAKYSGGCSNDVLVFTAKGGVDPTFLYYLLSDDAFFSFSTATSKGTKMPRGDRKAIMQYAVPQYDLPTQKKIGSILRSLDDKIELNNKINENLFEQMQLLYNSWFVDFEPFDGIKPDQWIETDIYSLANIVYGAPFASKKFNRDGIGKPIIRIRDLRNQQFETYTTENHPKGYLLQHGDIVVGMDGEFRPYIWGNDEAWLNQRICVFSNKRPNGKAFLYFTLKPLLYAVEQTQVATTVIHIGKKDFDAFKITLPDTKTLDSFDALTIPMVNQIVSNCFENRRLAMMRDVLLPKLMSGEIKI